MSKGGAAPYRKGAAFEREVLKHYESNGWLCVRQPKSQSPFDLLATKETRRHLIQCKLRGKISRQERKDLINLSDKHHYSPVLAYKEEGKIHLKYIDVEPMSNLYLEIEPPDYD